MTTLIHNNTKPTREKPQSPHPRASLSLTQKTQNSKNPQDQNRIHEQQQYARIPDRYYRQPEINAFIGKYSPQEIRNYYEAVI